jgi:hypothetical protein
MHMGLGPENGQPESADRCHAVGSRPANALGAEVTKLSTLTALKYLTFHAWLAIRQRGPLQSSEASVSVLGSRATSAVYLDALQRAHYTRLTAHALCTSSHRPDLEVADLSCLTTLRSFDMSAKTRYCKTSPRCPFLTALTSLNLAKADCSPRPSGISHVSLQLALLRVCTWTAPQASAQALSSHPPLHLTFLESHRGCLCRMTTSPQASPTPAALWTS